MAGAYYFDYISKPGRFKNSIVETKEVGMVLFKSVVAVLRTYGVSISNMEAFPLGSDGGEFLGYVTICDEDGMPMPDPCDMIKIEVCLSQDNRLHVDFVFDPLMKENSNDEIIADIKNALIEHKILESGAETHITNTEGRAEKKRTPTGGCYVATAVYGSYDCPEVWTLRRFRDFSLAKKWYGRIFIKAYYSISPRLVKWFGKKYWFRQFWKVRLDKMVAKLNAEGYSNIPYRDI